MIAASKKLRDSFTVRCEAKNSSSDPANYWNIDRKRLLAHRCHQELPIKKLTEVEFL